MIEFLTTNEGLARLSVFIGLFALMAAWELAAPRRALVASRMRRWGVNWAVTVLDAVVVRVLFVVLALAGAWDAAREGIGLFNVLDWPVWLEIVLTLVILDCLIYWQHVLSHRIPILWRFHKVHHSDRDIDVTTAIRFHPVEIALSMLLKIAVIYALGPEPAAVILFEIILNGCAMFNHSNIRIPARIDRIVRSVLVTPDMHRIHHSTINRETDANFGFSVPWWDRLFGTYIDQPEKGHEGMTIGLNEYQNEGPTRLGWTLWLPFRRR